MTSTKLLVNSGIAMLAFLRTPPFYGHGLQLHHWESLLCLVGHVAGCCHRTGRLRKCTPILHNPILPPRPPHIVADPFRKVNRKTASSASPRLVCTSSC